jgi:hypothetical protein
MTLRPQSVSANRWPITMGMPRVPVLLRRKSHALRQAPQGMGRKVERRGAWGTRVRSGESGACPIEQIRNVLTEEHLVGVVGVQLGQKVLCSCLQLQSNLKRRFLHSIYFVFPSCQAISISFVNAFRLADTCSFSLLQAVLVTVTSTGALS